MSGVNAKPGSGILSVVAFSALVIALGGCAQNPAQETPDPPHTPSAHAEELQMPGFVSLDEVPAFYEEAIKTFPHPLPEGMDWPSSLPAGFTDAKGHYEADGIGEVIASTYWQCVWTKEFLDAYENNGQARQAEALAMLEKRVTDPFFTAIYSDPHQGWKQDVLDPAKRGDISEMKSQHGSCWHVLNKTA